MKSLTVSGFTEAQAEALADEQAHLLDSNLATKANILAIRSDVREVKAEIREVKSELELKIEQGRSDLEVRIEQIKSDLLTWMVGALTAHAALIAGVVAGLIRFL